MGIRSSAAWPPYVGPRPRPASTPLGPGLEGSQRWQSPFHDAGCRSATALASRTRRPSPWHKGCHTLRCCNTCRGHSDEATVHMGRQADMAIPMKTGSVLMVDDNAAMREAIARSLERGGLWLWRQAVMVRPELRGRFVLIASEPLPDPHSMNLFLESERFLLKPLSLDTLWRLVEEAMQGAPQAAQASRAEPQQTRAGRVGGAP